MFSLGIFLVLDISHERLKTMITTIQDFGGTTMIPKGTLELLVTLGTYLMFVVIMTSFLVFKTPINLSSDHEVPDY